jgi:hypothetical protein
MRTPFRKALPDGPDMPIRKRRTDCLSPIILHTYGPDLRHRRALDNADGPSLSDIEQRIIEPSSLSGSSGIARSRRHPLSRLRTGRTRRQTGVLVFMDIRADIVSNPATGLLFCRPVSQARGGLSDSVGIPVREMSIPCVGDSADRECFRNQPDAPQGEALSGRRNRGPWLPRLSPAKCHDFCWSYCRIPGVSCQGAGGMGPWVGLGAPESTVARSR